MQLGSALVLSIFLLWASPLQANVITTVNSPGATCTGSQTSQGEFNATASLVCPGASGTASANLFDLSASASKISGVPPVLASASFDYLALVTGTDQPGFLLIYPNFSNTPRIDIPSRFQSSNGSLQGTLYDELNHPLYLYVPYSPGIPVHLYASVSGIAGAFDIVNPEPLYVKQGSFSVSFAPVIRVAAQGTANPFTEDPQYISGASIALVPEPSAAILAALGLFTIAIGRRLRH